MIRLASHQLSGAVAGKAVSTVVQRCRQRDRRFSLSSHCHHGVGLPPFVSVVTAAALPFPARGALVSLAALRDRLPRPRGPE